MHALTRPSFFFSFFFRFYARYAPLKIAAETGDPNAKPPKISLPFMEEEEPEVVTMPIPRDALADRYHLKNLNFEVHLTWETRDFRLKTHVCKLRAVLPHSGQIDEIDRDLYHPKFCPEL